jgi:hypothetical protein
VGSSGAWRSPVSRLPAIATPYAVTGFGLRRFVVATDRGFLVVDLQRSTVKD